MKEEFQISQLIQEKYKNNQFQWIIPIEFYQDLNMYRLNDNTFVNQLHQNHLGYKHQNNEKINQFRWYLLPEETLYLISIQEFPLQTQSNNNNQKKYKNIKDFEQLKQQNIRKIYSNCKKNDTIKLLFYLNIRKKSKIIRKCFTQLKFGQKINQKQSHLSKNFVDFCYKIYQTAADYRKDENYQIFVLVNNKSLITQMIFSTEIQKICQKFKVLTLKLVLFQNNDYMIIETATEA